MPFRASRVQSRLLATADEGQDLSQVSLSVPNRPSMDTTYLDLPSPLSKASEEASPFSPISEASTRVGPTRSPVGSGHSPISFSKYFPGKATAWWKSENVGNSEGLGNGERVAGDEDGVLSDSMVGGNAIGGVRQKRKLRVRSVVEMVGMVFVVLTLVGFVVACLGWMHAGSGPKGGKEILGRREDVFGGREWYDEP